MKDTVLFFLGINCSLRAGNKHYDLHHDAKDNPSQITFLRDANGIRYMSHISKRYSSKS